MERARQWSIRIMDEAHMHDSNVFVTLTYDDANVPPDGSLCYRHFQLFMKRLRKWAHPKQIRFYMCGEYGDNYGRPHFHACLFGVSFPDGVLWQRTASNELIYRSAALEALWPFGYSSYGEVTSKSAAYVARYVMKKVSGNPRHYDAVNQETGEIFSRVPEFTRMSLKPGIGSTWFEKYKSDVFPHDRRIVNGVEVKPPRYYDKKFKASNPDAFEVIRAERMLDADRKSADNTPRRLRVKREVLLARLSRLKRNLV